MTKILGRAAQWAGLVSISTGVSLIAAPAGLIVFGVGLVTFGALAEAGDA